MRRQRRRIFGGKPAAGAPPLRRGWAAAIRSRQMRGSRNLPAGVFGRCRPARKAAAGNQPPISPAAAGRRPNWRSAVQLIIAVTYRLRMQLIYQPFMLRALNDRR